ncbi:MAG: apolipoprotein acyltransferase [Planctomycetota bacterium]
MVEIDHGDPGPEIVEGTCWTSLYEYSGAFNHTLRQKLMTAETLLQRCQDLAAAHGCGSQECAPGPETSEAESLIGFFQLFRPDGEKLEGLYDGVDVGDELSERLEFLFRVAGENRRPQGGRDAYFIVRNSPKLPLEHAELFAAQWLEGLRDVATSVGDSATAERLRVPPKIRFLEGLPPKHPRDPDEQVPLLKCIQNDCSKLTQKVTPPGSLAELMAKAYYFIACDAMLRDFLMWPLFREATAITDPLRGYFMLWVHGVKFRIFQDDQIDFYLPRS